MKRVNTSRQTLAAKQRVSNYRPSGNIAPHVLNSTVSSSSLTAQVSIRRAGRSFSVGSLKINKGDKIILVASAKFAGRYYVCSGGKWSTSDQAVIARCRQIILQVEKQQIEKSAASTLTEVKVDGVTLVSANIENLLGWNAWRKEMVALMRA